MSEVTAKDCPLAHANGCMTGCKYHQLAHEVERLREALDSCLADLKAIKKRNQGGYAGDREAVLRQIGLLGAALAADAGKEEPMITVTISINDRVIFARSARRIKDGEMNTYKVDDGRELQHRYQDGALPLVRQMLDGVEEP